MTSNAALLRPFLVVVLLSWAGLAHATDDLAATPVSGWDDEGSFFSASWGQMVSSQLDREDPTAHWNLRADLPLFDSIGLRTQLRLDSIVFGDPDRLFSQMVHPGRTDYSIGFRLLPPEAWLGLEVHHVSSHAVASLYDDRSIQFEPTVGVGGASNYLSLLVRKGSALARIGVGGQWTDTNTAPMLLDLDGVLLNSRPASGPFASLRVPLRPGPKWHGHLSLLVASARDEAELDRGTSLAWGATLLRSVHPRAQVGLTYAGNNGAPNVKRADNIATAFLRLHWHID